MMKKKILKRVCAIALAGALCLTGCGKNNDAPELIDPILSNETFKPVEVGRIGLYHIEIANVMPEEYPVYFSEAANIKEILVDLGQYVKTGDVVAQMDITELESRRESLTEELQAQDSIYQKQKQINLEQIKIQKYIIQDAEEAGDKETITSAKEQIELLNENIRFDQIMCERQKKILNEDIEKLSKTINESQLIAPHDGYVSYVRDLSETSETVSFENIVIISDDSKLHLELDITINDDFYKNRVSRGYDEAYINANNKKIILKDKEYTNQKLVAIQSSCMYPNVRYDITSENGAIKMGDKIPVYFTGANEEDVVKIDKGSLFTTGNQSFVYVKTETGKEKREVTTGVETELSVEITSGLSEGEWVYYSSSAIVPEKYNEYKVCATEFTPQNNGIDLRPTWKYSKVYDYSYKGDAQVLEVMVQKGDEVKKGDVLCTLKSVSGTAKMVELRENIASQNKQLTDNNKSLDEGIKSLEDQIKAARSGKSIEGKKTNKKATPSDAEKQNQSKTLVLQLVCQKTIMEYQKEIQTISGRLAINSMQREYDLAASLSDESGIVKIVAKQDGVIGNLYAFADKKITAEKPELFKIYDESSKKIGFDTSKDFVGLGNKVSLTGGNGADIELSVVGRQGVAGKAYISSKDGKTYVTQSMKGNTTYLEYDERTEDKIFTETVVVYPRARITNAIVVPSYMVYKEVNQYSYLQERSYVWKIVDGSLVKQYVQIQEELNSSSEICILNGVEDGDVLANENIEKEESE